MNRDKALDVLVGELVEWPSFIAQTADVDIGEWYWGTSKGDCLYLCRDNGETILRGDWIEAKADARMNNIVRNDGCEDQSVENSGDINDEDICTDPPPSKYHVRNIWQGEEWLDFYTVWDAVKLGKTYQVGDSASEHAMKKGFAIGERSGGKSRVQDLKEMIQSLERAVELIGVVGDE